MNWMVEMFYYLFQSIQSVQSTSQSTSHIQKFIISFMQRTKKRIQTKYTKKKKVFRISIEKSPSQFSSQSIANDDGHIRETHLSIYLLVLFCFVCLCPYTWADELIIIVTISLPFLLLLIHMCNHKVLSSLLGMFTTRHIPSNNKLSEIKPKIFDSHVTESTSISIF